MAAYPFGGALTEIRLHAVAPNTVYHRAEYKKAYRSADVQHEIITRDFLACCNRCGFNEADIVQLLSCPPHVVAEDRRHVSILFVGRRNV